jgi:hypothetical protein
LQFIAANENLGTVSVIPRQIYAREISVRTRRELASFPPPSQCEVGGVALNFCL